MRFQVAEQRLRALPDPLPRGPRAIEPVVVAAPNQPPEWTRRPSGASTRDAAVLILIYRGQDGEAYLVLTERATGELRHSGQVSFPGGARDPGDDHPVGTALREAREEIGLDAEAAGVTVVGRLDPFDVRVSGFMLTPVLATAERAPALVADSREVAAILHVPLATFLPSAPIEMVEEQRDGLRLRYGAYRFGDHVIWGATAMILGQLGAALGDG